MRGGFCKRGSPLTQGVSQSPRSRISMGVRKESQYSSMPVTLVSDQIEGSSNRIPRPNTTAGTDAAGTFQGEANGLLQVTTFKKLQPAENLAAIKDFSHAQVFHTGKFPTDCLRRRMWFVGFDHVNGVLPFAAAITRPEKELVLRGVRRLKID